MSHIDYKVLLGQAAINELDRDAAVAWAIDLLEEFPNSKPLVILAGLGPRPDRSAYENLVPAILDCRLRVPSRQEAMWEYAYFLAREILVGTLSPNVGCLKLARLAEELEFPELLLEFIHLREIPVGGPNGFERRDIDSVILNECGKLVAQRGT